MRATQAPIAFLDLLPPSSHPIAHPVSGTFSLAMHAHAYSMCV
jgi:hypothetical protein